jgi:hypothetical protein
MGVGRLARAQRGIALARAVLRGPFLTPGSLTAAERRRLLDGIERVLEGVYTHLPLKRARYGFDPVQRLRILRSQIDELSDDAFHAELADTITRLRDAHTCYTGPASLRNKVAALPFLVEMFGPVDEPTYVVTKVARGLGASFKPGVELEYWNGVPIDRAVLRHGDQGFGGRPDSQRASALESLTLRPLRYGPPPDEHWVVIGYRTVGTRGRTGRSKEIRLPWQIVDPSDVAPELSEGPTGARAKALRRTRAIAPAAEAIRRAKMLLFAPHSLTARARPRRHARHGGTTARIIPTTLQKVLKAVSIEARGGPFGYLRIYAFDAEPEEFIDELIRLIPLLPDRGLIIDIRGNPGGYIWAAEMALQLFTPNRIEPTRFSAIATPFMRRIASIGDVREDLEPWKPSLDGAARNGELYAQAIPITDPGACNALGQLYGGPVVLVADSTTYSSGDLFSAGFVDNRMGPFICVGSATGAGGANVWYYDELRAALAGSRAALPGLPDGIDLSFSFRRATRTGANEGMPIEDVGISGTPHAMTLDDLLHDNCDLIAKCVRALKAQPFSRLTTAVDTRRRTISVSATGLDRVDARFDGRPGVSLPIDGAKAVAIPYPPRTKTVELEGCSGPDTRQRRRLTVRR